MKLFICVILFLKNFDSSSSLLPFTTGATNGYIAALSLPLGSPESNVFMSYNFEANYVLPTRSTDFTQGLYDKIFFVDGVVKNETQARMNVAKFFSRQHVYRIIEDKMNEFGVDGKACLLRMICETGNVELRTINGVLGSIVHLILTPSSSTNERDMTDYLEAEKSSPNCSKYHESCQLKILDTISRIQK